MILTNFATMDPIMLMSIINMKLRDEFAGDLTELCKVFGINQIDLEQKLSNANFVFFQETGQFR